MSLAPGSPCLSARGLSTGWRRGGAERLVSAGVGLAIRPGELAALIGPNGSGKSTLLRSLVGLQPPLAGEVLLGGEPVAGLPVEERARRAACVFTGRMDSGWFTVFDIVAFGRYPYTDARNRLSEADRAAVVTAIESVGMYGMRSRRFGELSDGERQKALIARAIAQDCPLLVLDEPTAFLDAGARIEVFHLALRLAREEGKAVILSTHDLDLAMRYADALWLLDRASRFRSGAPESLAMSGAIGEAFDGPSLRFDAASGIFKAAEGGTRMLVSVSGEEPAASWTERLVERLGFELARPTGAGGAAGEAAPDARVSVSRAPGGRASWALAAGGREMRLSSLDELADALRELERAPGARGRDAPLSP